MGVIALTSMPSITPKMNWREWRLLQSHAGWLAVTTATVRTALKAHLASNSLWTLNCAWEQCNTRGRGLHAVPKTNHSAGAANNKGKMAGPGPTTACLSTTGRLPSKLAVPVWLPSGRYVSYPELKPLSLPGRLWLQVHVLLLGAPWWPAAKEDWPQMIPTITLMATIPPMLLLILKGLLVLPPFSMVLSRVRSGEPKQPPYIVGTV